MKKAACKSRNHIIKILTNFKPFQVCAGSVRVRPSDSVASPSPRLFGIVDMLFRPSNCHAALMRAEMMWSTSCLISLDIEKRVTIEAKVEDIHFSPTSRDVTR